MFTVADLDKEARTRLYGAPVVTTVNDIRMSSGMPLFTSADIHATKHPLDIILRSLFVSKRISREFFSVKCREKAIEAGYLPQQANTTGSNLVRTLVAGSITISRFMETLTVLDLTLSDMTVTVRSERGPDELFGIQSTVNNQGVLDRVE